MIKAIKNYFDQDVKEVKVLMKQAEEILEEQARLEDKEDEYIFSKIEAIQEGIESADDLQGSILNEAVAIVVEVAKRTLGLQMHKEQIVGGLVLNKGAIAEMKTGEGKTLTATIPVFLRYLVGEKVHIFTVNDYLAKRDSDWMKPVFEMLGLKVGIVLTNSTIQERAEAYRSNVVYGTSTEFGFDYLRSNLTKVKQNYLVQEQSFVIVDEADTILIDQARSPINISDFATEAAKDYPQYVGLIEELQEEVHFELDQELLRCDFTEEGIEKIESLLGIESLFTTENARFVQRIQNALSVKYFMEIEKNYLVQEGKIMMVDYLTGRLMPGRRFPDGIQQALEAKEGVEITPELTTKATISFQNLLKQYKLISGMTGTAKTEEEELSEIYGLRVYEIPTHHPMIREDYHDVIYKTMEAKHTAIIEEVKEMNEKGRPVLIGTESVEESEILNQKLVAAGLTPNVLNAKNHEKEAAIIAKAGEKGALTVITNMAGRGTDIVISEEVNEIGGLHVIGTTRHENRRIDNQLRGRAGRQGDKGSSIIYVSLEDDLIKRFGGEQLRLVMNKFKLIESKPIEHPIATKLIEQMQMQSEVANASNRKFTTRYDDILNDHRTALYNSRKTLLFAPADELKEQVIGMGRDVAETVVSEFCYDSEAGDTVWMLDHVAGSLNRFFYPEDYLTAADLEVFKTKKEIIDFYESKIRGVFERKEKHVGLDMIIEIVRNIIITITDDSWIDHISTMEHLRQGLGIRGTTGGNPFLEFSIESHQMFDEMIYQIKEVTLYQTMLLQFQVEKTVEDSE